MGIIAVSGLPVDGTTADAADVNTTLNIIINEFNGNIDNANIKSGAAISGSKLAAGSLDIGSLASTWDGWIPVTDSWTYASATTVTVPSDATAKYSVGDKIKFSQSGTKYFYITAVAATTLTLNGGTDYTVANAAISSIYYSKASTPLNFPQWFVYTPTFANTTLGNGTVSGKFTINGKTLKFRAQFTLGSTSAIGTAPTVTFPVTSPSFTVNSPLGTVVVQDTGTAQYMGLLLWATTTTAILVVGVASGSYTSVSGLTTAIPIAVPAATDILMVEGAFELP